MKWVNRLATKMGGLAVASAIRTWMSTLDYKAAFYDPTIDPVDARYRGQKIYIFWHEYILFPLYLRGHCNLAMLLSRHRDADILTEIANHLGFEFVRGSTNAGGSCGAARIASAQRAHEPDDHARRPARPAPRAGPGAGFPVVQAGAADRRHGLWLRSPVAIESWDRFAIPRAFSRARAVVSPPMFIPPNLDRDQVEHYRQQVERMLNRLTCEAEAWAEAGTPKIDEVPVCREVSWLRRHPQEANRANAA